MTTAVAKDQKPQSLSTIKGLLQSDAFRAAIAEALPEHMTADRFLRIAITAMTRTPLLQECEQSSLLNCLLSLSQYGLEPDGRRAHLIPFRNNKRGVVECQLIIDWKGLAELIMRSGLVSNIHADIICENDQFDYDKGEIKRHVIDWKKPRGKPYAVYALCRMKDGTEKCDVMTMEEVAAIRSRSRAGSSGPWVTDFAEMSKKSVFRRLSKWLPLSPEIRSATEADDDQYEHHETKAQAIQSGMSKSDSLADMLKSRAIESADEESQVTETPTADQQPDPDVLSDDEATKRLIAAANISTKSDQLDMIESDASVNLPREHAEIVLKAVAERRKQIETWNNKGGGK